MGFVRSHLYSLTDFCRSGRDLPGLSLSGPGSVLTSSVWTLCPRTRSLSCSVWTPSVWTLFCLDPVCLDPVFQDPVSANLWNTGWNHEHVVNNTIRGKLFLTPRASWTSLGPLGAFVFAFLGASWGLSFHGQWFLEIFDCLHHLHFLYAFPCAERAILQNNCARIHIFFRMCKTA